MTIVTGITDQPKQSIVLVLPDGSQVSAFLEYRPNQVGWFANFEWQDWALNGLRLTTSPNLLRQWSNQIPFGLSIQTTGDREPLCSTDFSTGFSRVYLLDADDVERINTTTFAGL